MRLAVVRPALRRGLDRQCRLILCDLQLARRLRRQSVVAGAVAAISLLYRKVVAKAASIITNIYACRRIISDTRFFPFDNTLKLYVCFALLPFTIIYFCRITYFCCNFLRRDLQPAVCYGECHCVVRIRCVEAAVRQAHRVRLVFIGSAVDVRALGNSICLRRTADLCLRQNHSLGDADRVARYALLIAVVDQGVVVARDGHDQLGRRDFQPAVCHFESYRVVYIIRAKVIRRQAHRVRLVFIGSAVDVRALGNSICLRRTADLCLRQIHSLGDADLIPRYALLRAIIGLCVGIAGDRDRHGLRVDRQFAGNCRDHVVRRHVLSTVHDLVAGCDRVVPFRSFRYVRHAAGCGSHQHVAGQQAAARHRYCGVLMRAAVICPCLARRRDRDRHGRFRHGQLAVCCRYAVVARRSRRELVTRYHVCYRALARERDAACDRRTDRVVAHQANHIVSGVAVRVAVVGELFALRCHRHSLRVDRQRAVNRRDHVVRRHVFFAVHDLVAFCDRVVPRRGIRYVRHAAGCGSYQRIAGQQLAARHGNRIVAVRTAVIRPRLARRRDRDRHGRFRHGQLAILCRDGVVPRRAGRELVARYHVIYRALARERDAAFHNRSDRIRAYQAFHIILRPALRFARVSKCLVLRRDRYRLRRDRQGAGDEIGSEVVFCGVCTVMRDRVGCSEGASVGAAAHIGAFGGGVGNGQNVAFGQAFHRVVIGGNGLAVAGDGGDEGTAFLLGTAINLLNVLHRDLQLAAGHRQDAEILRDLIVIRIDSSPIDGVSVIAVTDRDLAAGGGNRYFTFIGFDQAIDAGFVLGQGCAVVGFFSRARGDRHRLGLDLQAAGTDVDADAVVVIFREFRKGQSIFKVGIVPGVALRNADIAQTNGSGIIGRLGLHRIPHVIQILCRVARMADDHVIRDSLGRVSKAGLLFRAVIDVPGPAVGLNADGDVDLCHLQGAADVLYRVIWIACGAGIRNAGERSILRGHGGDTGIDAANRVLGIGIVIIKRDPHQGMLRQQAFHNDLIGQRFGNRQSRPVILLAAAYRRYGDLLLVEQGELQTGCGVFVGDLVTVASGSPVVRGADDGLVQLPSGNGGAGEGKGLADLQVLDIRSRARNGVAGHIHKVHRDGSIFKAGVVEVEDVRLRAGGEDKGLLHGIRIELDPVQLGMGCIKRFIIHCRCHFDDGGGVAGDVFHHLFFCHRDIPGKLFRIQDILHRIAGGIRLSAVHKGDHILAVRLGQDQGIAVFLGAVSCYCDGRFGDRLSRHVVGVGHDLILSHRVVLFSIVHITDRIGNGLAAPVGINSGIRRDLGIPVEEGVPLRGGIPAFEDMASLSGRRLRGGDLLVLLYRLGIIYGCSIIAVHKRDRVRRRSPLGVEHQSYTAIRSTGRHLAEYVRISFALSIVIPAREGIITVHSALSLSGRPVISAAGNGRIVFDVGNRLQFVCAVIILDLIGMTVIIEIVG